MKSPALSQAALATSIKCSSHLKSNVSNLGICPIGSPKAVVSISYWTKLVAITTSPGYISLPIPPATPTLIICVTSYSLIRS